MGATRTIAKNTVLLSLGLLAGRVLAFLILKKMTPILGPDGVGIWGLATDLTTILLVIANFGLGTLVTREVARARGMTLPILWAALRVRWAMGAACYLFLIGYVHAMGFAPVARAAVLITGVAVFVEATAMACDAVLQAHDRVEYQTWGQIVSALVYFGLAFWFLEAGHGLMGVIWANLISRVARLAAMVPLMLLRTGPWRWRDEDGADGRARFGWRWMLKLGWPLFLSTTFGILYYKVDTVMLVAFVGEAATGIYVLGHRALDVLMMAPNIFATALFPALARYGAGAAQDAARMGERALRYMLAAVLPLTLFFMLAAGPIIRWIDRAGEFPDSIPVLQIVIWGLPFQAANTIFNRLLITAGRERVFVRIALTCMLVNVGCNLLLIPRYSYFGAAAATIASLAVSSLMHWRYLARTAYAAPLRRAVLGGAAALLAAWAASGLLARLLFPAWRTDWRVLPLHDGWLPFALASLAALLLYAAAVFLLRVLRADDLRLLASLFRRGEEG